MKIEEFDETKALVIQVMNENKISYNRDFSRMGAAGYPNDDCQALAEECLEIMAAYCKVGVNAGFNRSMTDSLDALSDICVQMSDRRKDRDAEKRRAQCEKKKTDILKDIKLSKVEEVPIKDLVFQYIDRSLQAIPGLIRKNPGQTDILKTSEKKLIQIRTSVEKALDGTSKNANEKAEKIIAHIQVWRDAAAASTCTVSTLSELDEAVGVSHEWNKLIKPVGARDRADANKLKYESDDIDKIAKANDLKERMDNLRSRIDTARNQLGLRYDTSTLEARSNDVNDKIAKLNAKREEAVEKYQMGTITDDYLIDLCDDIDDQLADLNDDLADLNTQISFKEQGRRNQESTLDDVENICDEIASYETEPAIYYTLGNNVPFESVDAIIGGVATDDQIHGFTNALRLNLRVAKSIRIGSGVIRDTTRSIKHEARAEMRKQKEEERAERAKSRGENPADAERIKQEKLAKILAGRAGGSAGGGAAQPVDPIGVTPARRKIGNADDDI